MKTSPDRFSKSSVTSLIEGKRVLFDVYTYESTTALYDVRVATGNNMLFLKNNRLAPREAHHDAILKHFGVKE